MNRTRVRRQANTNLPIHAGDIIVRKPVSNITERVVSYVIPTSVLEMVQTNNPNYTGQYSVVYFRQNLFQSKLNISQVLKYIRKFSSTDV